MLTLDRDNEGLLDQSFSAYKLNKFSRVVWVCSNTSGVSFGAPIHSIASVNEYGVLAVILHAIMAVATSILFLKMEWVI